MKKRYKKYPLLPLFFSQQTAIALLWILFGFGLLATSIYMTGCGQQGPGGVQGPPGSPGLGCTVINVTDPVVAPNGGAQITCSGTSVLVLNGSNGLPGSAITPVQLCPGVVSYPSTFIEYGWCMNNKLWGVYSANDGFLTYFPPGSYQSNAIGSRCNLTIGSNCQVSN